MSELSFQVGQKIGGKARVVGGKTTPPKPFTDGDLISIMEDVSRYYEGDAEHKKILRVTGGIGTARTRGPTITDLFRRELLIKIGKGKTKVIEPTPKAIQLIGVINQAAPAVSSPEMTARWEIQLGRIERGEITVEQFRGKQIEFCTLMVESIKGAQGARSAPSAPCAIEPLPEHGQACPTCKKGKLVTRVVKKEGSPMLGKRFISCDQQGCKYANFDAAKSKG